MDSNPTPIYWSLVFPPLDTCSLSACIASPAPSRSVCSYVSISGHVGKHLAVPTGPLGIMFICEAVPGPSLWHLMQALYSILTQQLQCPKFSNSWTLFFWFRPKSQKFEVSVIGFLCGTLFTSWGNTSLPTAQVVEGWRLIQYWH